MRGWTAYGSPEHGRLHRARSSPTTAPTCTADTNGSLTCANKSAGQGARLRLAAPARRAALPPLPAGLRQLRGLQHHHRGRPGRLQVRRRQRGVLLGARASCCCPSCSSRPRRAATSSCSGCQQRRPHEPDLRPGPELPLALDVCAERVAGLRVLTVDVARPTGPGRDQLPPVHRSRRLVLRRAAQRHRGGDHRGGHARRPPAAGRAVPPGSEPAGHRAARGAGGRRHQPRERAAGGGRAPELLEETGYRPSSLEALVELRHRARAWPARWSRSSGPAACEGGPRRRASTASRSRCTRSRRPRSTAWLAARRATTRLLVSVQALTPACGLGADGQ